MDQGCFECGRASEMTHGILSKHYFTPARAQVFFKKMPETGSTRDKYFMMLLCAFDFCFGKLCDGPTSAHMYITLAHTTFTQVLNHTKYRPGAYYPPPPHPSFQDEDPCCRPC